MQPRHQRKMSNISGSVDEPPHIDRTGNQQISLRNQLHPIRTTSTIVTPQHSLHSSRISTIVDLNDEIEYDEQSPNTADTQMTNGSCSSHPLTDSFKEKIDVLPQPSSIDSEDVEIEQDISIQHQQHRHPSKVRGSIYTRFFQLDTPRTQSNVIVRSSWLSTGALLSIRCFMFCYSVTVLVADMFLTERFQLEFCYLTQLSYVGLISYLGTVSWHTFSEWRRKRALQIRSKEEEASYPKSLAENRLTTSIERQYWLLTDMIFFLYHTICTFHVIVPTLFWGYMAFEGDAKNMAFDIPRNALWRNYSLHGGDLVLILIEFSINTMPFIPSYILIVYVISLLYLSEAFLVHRVDGVWMYPFLDTSAGPIWMGYYVGVGFVITCAFVLMYFLHRLRDQGLIKKREQQQRQKEQGRQQNQQLQQSQHQNDLGRSVYVMNDSSINTSSDQEGMNEIVYFNNNGERFAQHLDNHDDSPKNRDRSWSVGSNVSTAPTLVGVDEGRSPQDMEQDRTSSKRTNRRVPLLGGGEVAPTIPEIEESFHEDPERGLTHSGRLEVVQEGNEIEHEDSKENQHP